MDTRKWKVLVTIYVLACDMYLIGISQPLCIPRISWQYLERCISHSGYLILCEADVFRTKLASTGRIDWSLCQEQSLRLTFSSNPIGGILGLLISILYFPKSLFFVLLFTLFLWEALDPLSPRFNPWEIFQNLGYRVQTNYHCLCKNCAKILSPTSCLCETRGTHRPLTSGVFCTETVDFPTIWIILKLFYTTQASINFWFLLYFSLLQSYIQYIMFFKPPAKKIEDSVTTKRGIISFEEQLKP